MNLIVHPDCSVSQAVFNALVLERELTLPWFNVNVNVHVFPKQTLGYSHDFDIVCHTMTFSNFKFNE